MRKPIYVTDRKFTGDTGCALDYQIGFEDECGGYCNFLGIGNKKEASSRADVLSEVRSKYYPAPSACATGTEQLPKIKGGVWTADAAWENATCGSACQYVAEKLPQLRQDLAEAKRKVDAGQSVSVNARYVDAYNTVLGEYTAYYNNNCLGTVDTPPTSVPTTPGNVNTDPILQSATPTGSAATAQGNSTTSPAGTSSLTGAGQPGTTGNGAPAPSSSGSITVAGKQVPKWAIWTGVGLVVVIVVAVAVKGKGKTAKAVAKNG